MALKKKLVTHRYEGEYESPDGEIYDCAAIHSGDRCYIQWQLQNSKSDAPIVTIDGAMLEGLYEWYLDMTGKKPVSSTAPHKLRRPSVTDHRYPQGLAIHSQVKKSMNNYDDEVRAVESFSSSRHIWDGQQGTAEMRTGLDPAVATEKAPSTPEQWQLNDKDGPQWKQEAQMRSNIPRPQYASKGAVGERVRRVGVGDII